MPFSEGDVIPEECTPDVISSFFVKVGGRVTIALAGVAFRGVTIAVELEFGIEAKAVGLLKGCPVGRKKEFSAIDCCLILPINVFGAILTPSNANHESQLRSDFSPIFVNRRLTGRTSLPSSELPPSRPRNRRYRRIEDSEDPLALPRGFLFVQELHVGGGVGPAELFFLQDFLFVEVDLGRNNGVGG